MLLVGTGGDTGDHFPLATCRSTRARPTNESAGSGAQSSCGWKKSTGSYSRSSAPVSSGAGPAQLRRGAMSTTTPMATARQKDREPTLRTNAQTRAHVRPEVEAGQDRRDSSRSLSAVSPVSVIQPATARAATSPMSTTPPAARAVPATGSDLAPTTTR